MSNILYDSRYVNQNSPTPAYQVDTTGETYWGTRVPISLPPDATDRQVKPKAGERWDQFAYRVYGPAFGERATRLSWIVWDLNDIVNPLAPPDPDKALRCPSPERILLEVLG